MRVFLHLLLLASLVWCALGIAEPAEARAASGIAAAATGTSGDPADDGAAVAEHHHCPVAPALPAMSAAAPPAPPCAAPVAARIVALASLTRAPPLQPPAA